MTARDATGAMLPPSLSIPVPGVTPGVARRWCTNPPLAAPAWIAEPPPIRRPPMPTRRPRVHPKYKTKYRVTRWPEYDRGLVRRGDLSLWISPEAIDAWKPRPSGTRCRRRDRCAGALRRQRRRRADGYFDDREGPGTARPRDGRSRLRHPQCLRRRRRRCPWSCGGHPADRPLQRRTSASILGVHSATPPCAESVPSAAACGSASRATTGKARWRTRSSAGRRSSARRFVLARRRGGRSKPDWGV